MSNKFASGFRAIASCDRCGFRYKLKELKELVIKTKNVNIWVCPECWEEDQPQLQLGMYPIEDPQALRIPRPELGIIDSRDIQWGWNPVGGSSSIDAYGTPNRLFMNIAVGTVMVNVAAWSSTTNYSINDAVSYSGSYYLAIKENLNQVPTDITYWQQN
jgi:hypothetical protein